MNQYFAQLRPVERRLAVAVIVIVIVVLNWVYIWPHFSDWGKLSNRLEAAQRNLKLYQQAKAQIPGLQAKVNELQQGGNAVPPQDMAINLLQTIQQQAAQSNVGITSTARQTSNTNDAFFVEQIQSIQAIANDEQLVDFLYKLGSGPSMIRVRDLELQPDPPHQHLSANIELVASFQKSAPAVSAPPKSAIAKVK